MATYLTVQMHLYGRTVSTARLLTRTSCHITVKQPTYTDNNKESWTRSIMRMPGNSHSETQLGKIKNSIREQIQSGIYKEGQKIPSERELSELFATTRITLKDALISLETEGLIYREDRRGWFVSPERIRYNPLSRSHFHQMIRDQKSNCRNSSHQYPAQKWPQANTPRH